jgi:hypothetical protein
MVTKALVAFGVAAVALSAVPASARQYSNQVACSGWRDGVCVAWNRLTLEQARKVAVGTVFGPNYTYYVPFNTIPQAVVTQYHLEPTYRYVTADGYTYVVDPHSFAVIRVIPPAA